jgi:NAD(P)H-dependent FMN reductase
MNGRVRLLASEKAAADVSASSSCRRERRVVKARSVQPRASPASTSGRRRSVLVCGGQVNPLQALLEAWPTPASPKEPSVLRIAIIVGSTRPGRKADTVAAWVHAIASRRSDAEYEVVDIADYRLPLLDEPIPPSAGEYSKPHTLAWAERIRSFDGFVFVTPEYNHATSGALKNALDFLYQEWNNKAAGFVSYGSIGGVRAVENLRLIMAELQIADVRAQVALSLFTDFEKFTDFRPDPRHESEVGTLLDQVVNWSRAMKTLR